MMYSSSAAIVVEDKKIMLQTDETATINFKANFKKIGPIEETITLQDYGTIKIKGICIEEKI